MSAPSNALIVPPRGPHATNAAAIAGPLRDIKPPVPIPPGWLWLAWTLGALLALALVAWAVRRWLRRRATPAPPLPPTPPHVRARERLQHALALLAEPKPFCIEVSDALRAYLEDRFQLRAPDRTTEEFLDELQRSPLLSLAQKQSLGDFLARCDLVKFARYQPGEPELRDLWDAAARLIDETAPAPEPLAPTSA